MKNIRNLFICLAAALLLLSGCSSSSSKTENYTVKKTISNKVESSGIVTVSNIEDIVLDFQAKVTNINVKEGQKLKKGDVIMSLDLSDINSQISEKKKEIQAENLALANYEKNKEALVSGEGSIANNDNTGISSNDKDYVNGQLDNEIQAEKEKISVLQDALNTLQGKLNKSYLVSGNIVCDIDNAVIKEISYKKGDIITPSQKVGSLLDLKSLMIEAKVDEQFIKDVQLGKAVNITPAADESRKYTGKVQSISSAAVTENGDTYVPVMISLDNNDGFLLPNFNVDLEISK